jgi:hypothetical protein
MPISSQVAGATDKGQAPGAKFDLNEPGRPLHVSVIDRIFFDQPVSI